MSDNLATWNNLKQPPKTALKEIRGGRLSGMTDIKPQWRYKAMTEQFGPCGFGWYYTIDKEWTEAGSEGQVLCFVNASLFIKSGEEWSKPIPGTGGSTLIAKESRGLHSSDEGFKMALTDALSVAMGRIGVAADIYMGNWTGSKYKDEVTDKVLDTFKGSKVVMCVMEFDEQLSAAKTHQYKKDIWEANWKDVKPQCGPEELEKFRKIYEKDINVKNRRK